MKYRFKPVVVEAWKVKDQEKTVPTLFGAIQAQAGDWIIRRKDGEVQAWKSGSFMDCLEPVQEMRSFIHIQFQEGPVKEGGINGAQVEDVIMVLEERLAELNKPPFACRENAIAIHKLAEARLWLQERRRFREGRGVEGTAKP